MNWKILSQTVTAGGDPREFMVGEFDGLGEERMFVIAAERMGGPDDTTGMPRRCMGTGSDRASARRSLEATIKACDPMGRIVPAR